MTTEKRQKSNKKPLWIIPFLCIIVIIISFGGYYGYRTYAEYSDQQQRIQESSIQESIRESIEQDELAAMRQVLDQEVFYNGIYINDLSLDGKTYKEVQTQLQAQDNLWREAFGATLKLDDQAWPLKAADSGLKSDWQAILDQAWSAGRSSAKTNEIEQIRDRYAMVEALQKTPLRLSVTRTYDEALIRAKIIDIAGSLATEAVGARATDFNVSTKKFTLAERKLGRTIDGNTCADTVLKLLAAGRFGETVSFAAQTVTVGMDAATMQKRLGLVSQGTTYAKKVNVPRDNNIMLICQKLNGLLLQPGATFSFNGTIGQRTAAKGYMEAGGIRDGILIAELGGGICQPNTTMCHAVLKADLEIVERHPHSWPSDYVPVGQDATVTWGGADFKFRNDTAYPVAIVAWYKKPSIVFQIYGRVLDEGVTIELETEHNGYIPEAAPKETFNPALKPGVRIETRAPHTGQRATAFKIWKKNGAVIKKEIAFTSYYRPIQGLYEYGPPAPTTAPTAGPTAAPTAAPTVAPTAAPTAAPPAG